LSLVESSFNPRAVSYAGAAGVWQFMPDSGAEFMRVNPGEGIDERISPIKSTAAAARLLQRNYKMLGSWPAAIGAYNHGHSKWRRIPQEQRREPGKILAQCSRSPKVSVKLGFASRNYYAEFLALLRAERYQDRAFGPPPSLAGQPVRFVSVGAPSRVDSLAQEHGLAPKTLLELNPDILSAGRLIPSGFLLAVPSKQDEFKTVIAEVGARQRRFQTNRSARKSALQAAYSTSPGSYAASGRKRKG
ncbi:MAG: lytic transglycosylase domain-containing protein, partial [Oligoflexia bacterium]